MAIGTRTKEVLEERGGGRPDWEVEGPGCLPGGCERRAQGSSSVHGAKGMSGPCASRQGPASAPTANTKIAESSQG